MLSVRRPEMLQSGNKQHIYEECQVKSMCSDNNCQDTYMQPVKPSMKTNYMW